MEGQLGALRAPRRTGAEAFHNDAAPLPFTLNDFWAWSVSDLVSNATRGRLAEYLVARALGISTAGVRDEWAAYDLITPAGLKIEVKSAAYMQAWAQRRPSPISFSTRRSRSWDAQTGVMGDAAERNADVYVFALVRHMEKATLDPMNVAQWAFYAVAARQLAERRRSQDSITLKSLEALVPPVDFEGLPRAVAAAESYPESG